MTKKEDEQLTNNLPAGGCAAMRGLPVLLICLIVIAMACATSVFAAPSPVAVDAMLNLTADNMHYSEADGQYIVDGGVTLQFEKYEISTQKVSIDEASETVTIDGEYILKNPDYEIRGARMRYFPDTQTAQLEGITTCIRGVNISAASVAIMPDGAMDMKDVRASTCMLDAPDYHVTANEMQLTADGRAKFKKINVYFLDHKVFRWKKYETNLINEEGVREPEYGRWVFAAPSVGFANYGGLMLNTGITRAEKNRMTMGVDANYFMKDGFFASAYIEKPIRQFEQSRAYLRYGKQYKVNNGYFRFFDPVVVWNEPVAGITAPVFNRRMPKLTTKIEAEAGALKEAGTGRINRAAAKVESAYPLSAARRQTRFSLLFDARYAAYDDIDNYGLVSGGIELLHGRRDDPKIRLQYMKFSHSGSTPFQSDYINGNDKMFGYTKIKINRNNDFKIDSQYDMDETKFDEVAFFISHRMKCLSFDIGWEANIGSLMTRMQILGLGGSDK